MIAELAQRITPLLAGLGFKPISSPALRLWDNELVFRNAAGLYLKFLYTTFEGWITIMFGRLQDTDSHVQLSATYQHFLDYYAIESSIDFVKLASIYFDEAGEPTLTLSERFSAVVGLIEETLPQLLARCTLDEVSAVEQCFARRDKGA